MSIEQHDLAQRIRALGPWFHNLRLGGVETAPDHFLGDYPTYKWQAIRDTFDADLSGVSVLDIGCNGGFYAIEMARRGAGPIVAIDVDPRYLAQARLAAEVEGVDIEFHEKSVYELESFGRKFDLVLFMGVFYHLRYPLLALDLLRQNVVGDLMLFQSLLGGEDHVAQMPPDFAFADPAPFEEAGYPRLHFVEHRYAGDPSNWFIPNRAAVEAMLRSAGFTPHQLAEPDIYLCEVDGGGHRRA